MSHYDPLTGLGNRFALEEYVEQVDRTKSIGVVYCDISGLKRVNDEQGHLAGDNMIRRAAQCLKDVFANEGLFRIGGDELLVLCPDVKEEVFTEKIRDLRAKEKEHDVVIAIGSVWKNEASESMDRLMTDAERWMYSDKAAYYKQMGMNRRKY